MKVVALVLAVVGVALIIVAWRGTYQQVGTSLLQVGKTGR